MCYTTYLLPFMSKWRVKYYHLFCTIFLFQEVDDVATLSNSYRVSCRSGQKLSFTARLQSVKHNTNRVARLQVRISGR